MRGPCFHISSVKCANCSDEKGGFQYSTNVTTGELPKCECCTRQFINPGQKLCSACKEYVEKQIGLASKHTNSMTHNLREEIKDNLIIFANSAMNHDADEISESCEASVDAILDAVRAALPQGKDPYRDGSDLSYQMYGYNSALSEVRNTLEAAKKGKE